MQRYFEVTVSAIQNLPNTIKTYFDNTVTSITTFFQSIFDALKAVIDSISSKLTTIAYFIDSIPKKVLEGIQSIFIPDQDALKEDIAGLLDNLKHTFNLTIDSQNWLVDSFEEKAFEDIEGNYFISGVGNFKLKFFDTSFLKRGIEYFRPIIRGFIVLLLCFYHYRQVLSFIGQDPGMYSNAHTTYMESKGGGKD